VGNLAARTRRIGGAQSNPDATSAPGNMLAVIPEESLNQSFEQTVIRWLQVA
jgi:hypothetical protein